MCLRFSLILLAILLPFSGLCADKAENIVIDDMSLTYTLVASGGKLKSTKIVNECTYKATSHAETVLAHEFYSDHISIDKAKAPGAKPIYRSWEDGDMFYSGSRVCVLPVRVEPGKPTKVLFEKTIKTPEQGSVIHLSQYYDTRHCRVSVKVPAELAGKMKVTPYNLDPCMKFGTEEKKDGSMEYFVESTDLKAYKSERDAPSPAVIAPKLIITGLFADWKELYGFVHSLVPEISTPDSEVAQLTRQVIAGAPDDKAKVDSIVSWVRQNIRYVAVEHGEYGIKPGAGGDVLAARFGDCKCSASLIKDMLCQAGIDGRLVWIGTKGRVPTSWTQAPILGSGNHMIAAAVLNDTILYLDGTASWIPPRYTPPNLRGVEAMMEDGETGVINIIPDHGDARYDIDEFTGRYAIAGNDLSGTVVRRLGGYMREGIISSYNGLDARKRTDFLSRVLSYKSKNTSVSGAEISIPYLGDDVTVNGSVVERGAARKVGEDIYLSLRPFRRSLDVYRTSKRVHPFNLGPELTCSYDYEVDVPEGYEPQLPERLEAISPWYEGVIEYTFDNSVLRCKASLSQARLDAAPEDLTELNAALKELRRISDINIVLRPVHEL